jgi:adenosylcobyric acid synthase
MNPVLLKPESDRGSQVVVQGHAHATMTAVDYLDYKRTLMPRVMESYSRLRGRADLVIVEGAGSISEVNLRAGDISNMGFACEANIPVILAADIDRGGAIASIIGSWTLLPDDERVLLKGYIMNKFRGDLSVLAPALDVIRERSGLPCFGVLKWFGGAARFPAEDSFALASGAGRKTDTADDSGNKIKIYVLALSRISNFDDFDPLSAETDVDLAYVRPGEAVPGDGDLVIIPGTKSTLGDMEFVRSQGWDVDIAAHIRRGGRVLGICGGYQMLGKTISDPHAAENPEPRTIRGLGLIDVSTVMKPLKTLRHFEARTEKGDTVAGYEIHIGSTTGPGTATPMFYLDGAAEGAFSEDGRAFGCYVHGLFTSDSYRARFLSAWRGGEGIGGERSSYGRQIDETLDELADDMERQLDINAIARMAGV